MSETGIDMDLARQADAFRNERIAIIRELAVRGPFTYEYDNILFCADCNGHAILASEADHLNDPSSHKPRCLWRRSKVLHP